MGIFSRTSQHLHPADVAAWRGRSRELADAAVHPWELLMAALETAGPQATARTGEPFAALGLDRGELGSRWIDDLGGVRLTGVRHGRQVEIRIGLRERNWGNAAAMVTWVRAATADLHMDSGRDGTMLSSLSPQPKVWAGVRVRGGAEGLVALRKMTARTHSQGYLYDLWLLEHLADKHGAAALPGTDLAGFDVPYRMG
jgi:hypothetical protein